MQKAEEEHETTTAPEDRIVAPLDQFVPPQV